MSFFLPAFDTYYWSEPHHVSGFGAVGHSLLMGIASVAILRVSSIKSSRELIDFLFYFIVGTLWIANVLMGIAPLCLSQIERGLSKGGTFTAFLSLVSLEALALFIAPRRSDPVFLIGSYVWGASICCTSILFLALWVTNKTKALKPRPSRAVSDE
jgi:hypothetical protein